MAFRFPKRRNYGWRGRFNSFRSRSRTSFARIRSWWKPSWMGGNRFTYWLGKRFPRWTPRHW